MQGTWESRKLENNKNLGSKVEHASGCKAVLLDVKSTLPGVVSHHLHGSIQETLIIVIFLER